MYRTDAIGEVFRIQAEGSSDLHTTHEALLLTAAGVWLLNSLYSRPDDGPASQQLMQAILPLASAQDIDHDLLAVSQSGCPSTCYQL